MKHLIGFILLILTIWLVPVTNQYAHAGGACSTQCVLSTDPAQRDLNSCSSVVNSCAPSSYHCNPDNATFVSSTKNNLESVYYSTGNVATIGICTRNDMMSDFMKTTYDCSNACIEDVSSQVSPPAFTEDKSLGPGNTYTGTLKVTITTGTAGALIKYTADGSTPTPTSQPYVGPITLPIGGSTTNTIKAVALKTAMINSTVTEKIYTQLTAPTPGTGECGTHCFVTGSPGSASVACEEPYTNKCGADSECQGSPGLQYYEYLNQLLPPFYNTGGGHNIETPYNIGTTKCTLVQFFPAGAEHACISSCKLKSTSKGTCSISTDVGHPLTVACVAPYVCPPSVVGSTPGTTHECVPCGGASSYAGVCINLSNTCCPGFDPKTNGTGCVCQVPGCDDACIDASKPPSGSGTPNRCCAGKICTPEAQATTRLCVDDPGLGGTITSGSCFKADDDGYYRKLNCSGKCSSIPADETGVPCVACGLPEADPGICAFQPNGEIFDSCCPGSVAQRDGANCVCESSKDAVYRLFDIINGIVMPIVVILGIFQIVLKGYKIMTSQGDPTALQEGKEGLTSAIIGLIFVLMAVSILRVIIKALITGDADPLPI